MASRGQKSFLVVLALATAGVFLVAGWIAYGDTLLEALTINGREVGVGSSDDDATVWAIGDSLMVGASEVLEEQSPGIVINAEVGRKMDEGIDVLEEMLRGGMPNVLVVALGTNNGVTTDQIDEVMALAQNVEEVVFVNIAVPRPWESSTNEAIGYAADAYSTGSVVDWNAESAGNRELFRTDGYHLSQNGTTLWVDLIITETTN